MMHTTMRDRFLTLEEARAALASTEHWDWGDTASWGEWVQYAYGSAFEHWDHDRLEWVWDHDATLRAYLVCVGVDPADFQL